MYLDVIDLRDFYAEELGATVRQILGQRISTAWPTVRGDRILGLGYATPYLSGFQQEAERVIAFMPAAQGVVNWPAQGPGAAALVHEDMLPLADASVDRVLLIHALEVSNDPREVLREVWRVLSPGGRIFVVVPNRRGLWARVDTSPFGYGRPFSRRQMTMLLRESQFSPLLWSEALHMLPMKRRKIRRPTSPWETIGQKFWPAFAGVIIVEATKLLYQGIPAKEKVKARASFRPALIPAGASPRPTAG
ncbi:class I SAM-dependent methyltransferase [Methylobrevis pamukkalensis]|uniref:Methyltransferase type 11 domain-containing protein n=1 Tax=Methylobrevis pamukkalensis TaxID=1439726 RepID=A0A1E3H8N0_9HYPH|nr:class I SAM-dependent methyltransferase [Methylobrevis pamukkalensis]ODN72644.1 hypothetical protein A6302_00137 [Methylobrevis pamukkalensis]